MGKRESYEPGTFSWLDLSTSDADGAKTFYGEFFGWEFEDSEVPGGGVYTMCHVQGDAVAAIIQQDEHPGHWNNYVTVTSADETAAKAKQLGAKVFEEPFDVMEAGRMAVFADPGGACTLRRGNRESTSALAESTTLAAWAGTSYRRAILRTRPTFYSDLFGWTAEPIEQDGKTVYVTIKNSAGRMNGGFMPMTEQQGGAPSYWLPYFIVTSCDEGLSRIEELGGELLAGPMEPGGGRIAVASDPQGAVFAIFEGETDE